MATIDNPDRLRKKKKTKKGANAEFISEARERFKESASAESGNRGLAQFDDAFENGNQYTDEELQQRKNRPSVTVNKVAASVKGICGSARQNRPRIKVVPVDSVSDPKIARILNELIRDIENNSDAEGAYD